MCIGYDLDKQVNVLSITEPRGRYVENYQLDIQDRVTAVTNIEGQVMTMDYTVGDFVAQTVRFDGTSISNAYDAAGRKESSTYRTAGFQPATVAYSYWPGEIKTVSDGFSSISNGFDRLNRLIIQTVEAGSQQSEIGNAYTYDAAERLSEILHHGGTETQSFVHVYSPNNGRISSVSNTESGITCSYEYDLMDRVAGITYRASDGSLIRSLDYAYDDASMIVQKRISNSEQGTPNSEVNYTYDSLNRLLGEHSFTNGVSQSDIHYSYDLAGNRLTKTLNGLGCAYVLGDGNRLASTETIYAIDFSGSSSEPIGTNDQWGVLWVSNTTANTGWIPQIDGTDFWVDDLPLDPGTNQLVSAIRDAAGNVGFATNSIVLDTPALTASYQYSEAGCLVGITNTQQGISNVEGFTWDERYRLVSASSTLTNSTTSTVSYSYDVLNRRISRIEGSTTNYYVYNGNQVVADLDGSGNLIRSYAWGAGIDNLLSFTDHTTNNTYYAIKDHQNTVIALADETGSVVESYEYDAYGTTKIFDASGTELTTSTYGNRYLFQGREYDSTTGLYYFRARWYDPNTGRWLSKDPSGISGGLNQYEFCASNPVMFVDPTGLRWSLSSVVGMVLVVASITATVTGNLPAGIALAAASGALIYANEKPVDPIDIPQDWKDALTDEYDEDT